MDKNYIVASGAWYTKNGYVPHGGVKLYGASQRTHQSDFWNMWYKAVAKYSSPEEIYVTDAHTEFMPDICVDNKVPLVWNRRAHNLGHCKGWKNSVIEGAKRAWNRMADLVYIEQDCLIWGDVVDRLLDTEKRMRFGCACKTNWDIQQCFFYVEYCRLPMFWETVKNSEIHPPEKMFAEEFSEHYDVTPFCGGRERYKDMFKQEFGYAQHLKDAEIDYLKGRFK